MSGPTENRTAPMPALSSPEPQPGTPLGMGAFSGFLYPGERATGVLLLGAVGFEEFCARRSWRQFAEMISARGLPCLRFDYPGTADALDPRRAPDGIDDWIEASRMAAAAFRTHSGVGRLILVGQGLGACLAAIVAPKLEHVEAIVLMAPPPDGRIYLRKQAMWSRIVSDAMGIAPDPSGLSVAGMLLEPDRARAIGAIDLRAFPQKPAPRALVAGRMAQAGVADALERCGVTVSRIAYDGYEQLLTDPTNAIIPTATFAAIADWLATVPCAERRADPPVAPAEPALIADDFIETPLRFGRRGGLFGIVCRPRGTAPKAAVLFVEAGRNPHIGWARGLVDDGRRLARLGFASLRFDCTAIGDSSTHPDAPDEILFSDWQAEDIRLAVDCLGRSAPGPVVIAGRCSGAALALEAAVNDARVAAAFLVNPPFLVRDHAEALVAKIRDGHRRLKQREETIAGPGEDKLRDLGLERFRRLRDRGTRLILVYTRDDPGLRDLERLFGADGPADYPNVILRPLSDADHNFTQGAARQDLFQHLAALTKEVSSTARMGA